MDYLTQAILSLRPGSEFSFSNNDYSTIHWDILEGNAPTKTQIDAEIEKIKANELVAEQNRVVAKTALLERLGITEAEAKLLVQ
jgi:hypothetical protein